MATRRRKTAPKEDPQVVIAKLEGRILVLEAELKATRKLAKFAEDQASALATRSPVVADSAAGQRANVHNMEQWAAKLAADEDTPEEERPLPINGLTNRINQVYGDGMTVDEMVENAAQYAKKHAREHADG